MRAGERRTRMSFEAYVAQQGQALLRLAFVLVGDAQLAEDLSQTALTDAYRHWNRVSAAQNPDAYVRRMLVNAHLNWRRRRSSHEEPRDFDVRHEAVAEVSDHADDVAARDHTRRMLANLSPRARTVLVLRYYADLGDAEIGEIMGITAAGVRTAASRALAQLRDGNGVKQELR
jgi:RNA polymerase sigma-70 factor (sigma-E family)